MGRIRNWVGGGIALVCFALLFGSPIRAQETADVIGTVTDVSGGVLPGVTVTLTNTGTGISQTTQTAADGDYVFTLLQVGNYSVKVEAKGFKTFVAPSIALSAADRARVDAKMEVGEQSTTVEVQAAIAPALQTDSSQVGALVSSQSVEDLPLNDRNLIKLVQLSPGITEGAPNSIAVGNRSNDARLTSAFSANGQSDTYNNNLVDGVDNNERSVGVIGVRPSIDAIQEVNVQTNKYDASAGHTGGAVVDVITKSGTNNFHGSVYEFFRNKVLNTNPNWAFTGTSAPNPAFRQNDYGASLGGPIKKNKTFFFADWEILDYAQGSGSATLTVPTNCEKGRIVCPDGKQQVGDFSDNNPISLPGGSNSQPSAMGPDVTATSTLGLAYFNMYPLPTCGPGTAAACVSGASGTVNNFTSSPLKTFNSNTYDGRVDEHFSDSNSLFGRYTHNHLNELVPNNFPNVEINPATGNLVSSGGVSFIPAYSSAVGGSLETQDAIALSYVHVYNPNLLLNLKAATWRSSIISVSYNNNTDISNKLGFPCTATSCVNAEHITPGIVGSGLMNVAFAAINGSNTDSTLGDRGFLPLTQFDTVFQYLGTVTWNRNAHSVRFGLGLIRRRLTIGQSNSPQGTMTFNGSYTGVGLGDLLEGLPVSFTRSNVLDSPGYRMWEPSVYVQDDWHARPWLTLNLGVRYDIFTPFTEVHGRISNYDPYTGLVQSPTLPGVQQSGPTAGIPTPMRDVAPRLGFAATLGHNTVVRGGFGLSFYPDTYNSTVDLKNAPFLYAANCAVQNETASASSCASAQFDGAAGQFSNGIATEFGTCPYSGGTPAACQTPTPGSTLNSSSTVYNPVVGGALNSGTTPGAGGALMSAGLPVPVLNIATATNPALYANTGTIQGIAVNIKDAYLEQFNLELQKQFGPNVLNLGYVGELGRHQPFTLSENLPANPTENVKNGLTLPMVVGGATALGDLQGYPYFNSITTTDTQWEDAGTSSYQALQASVVRRFSHGLTVNFNYVWSHLQSDGPALNGCDISDFATPEPCWFDAANGTGPALTSASPINACVAEGPTVCKPVIKWQQKGGGNGAQDVADRFSWGINYDIPFGSSLSGVEGAVLKGWSVNTSGSWQTGLPFSVTPSLNTTGLSAAGNLDQTCSGRLANPTVQKWYNYNCFVQPTTGTLGNEETNELLGPSQKRLDGSLFKAFALKEGVKLQFRAEVFNLFNMPNFSTPSGTAISFNSNGTVNLTGAHSTTGSITTMNVNWEQREIQFALKLLF
jgi:hypothetical protein